MAIFAYASYYLEADGRLKYGKLYEPKKTPNISYLDAFDYVLPPVYGDRKRVFFLLERLANCDTTIAIYPYLVAVGYGRKYRLIPVQTKPEALNIIAYLQLAYEYERVTKLPYRYFEEVMCLLIHWSLMKFKEPNPYESLFINEVLAYMGRHFPVDFIAEEDLIELMYYVNFK